MTIFIGYRSSYEYWCTNDLPTTSASSRMRPTAGVRGENLEAFSPILHTCGIATDPLHLVVAHANDRRRTKDTVYHVCAGPVPSGSYIKLEEGICISSPNKSFVEMAQELSLVELVRYGYILCSSYAYEEGTAEGFRERAPLTTARSLQKFVSKFPRRHGVKNAVRALRFIADLSASPMETRLSIALSLPRMLGGYGLDLPELNPRIEARAGGLVGRSHFSCDLYWRKQRVAVEYDSSEHHSGSKAETRDSARRSALIAQGVSVVTITRDQFFDARKLDEAARAVAKLLDKRLPANEPSWMMKRYKLRSKLLQDMSSNERI